jgi:hypothetical protein
MKTSAPLRRLVELSSRCVGKELNVKVAPKTAVVAPGGRIAIKTFQSRHRLRELSRKIELGFFSPTKQVSVQGQNGQFQGTQTEANPSGIAADTAVVGAGAVGAGALHNAVMNNYGTGSKVPGETTAANAYGNAARNLLPPAISDSVVPAASKVGGLVDTAGATGIGSKIGNLLKSLRAAA